MKDFNRINEKRLGLLDWYAALKDMDTSLDTSALDIFLYADKQPGGTVTGRQLEDHFGVDIAVINQRIVQFGKRVVKNQHIPEQINSENGQNQYWNIPFTTNAERPRTEGDNHFIWIVRPELHRALEELF